MYRLSKNNFEYYKNKTLKMQEDGIPSNFDTLCTWQFYDLKEFMFYLGFTLHSTPKQKFYWHKHGGLFEPTQYVTIETVTIMVGSTLHRSSLLIMRILKIILCVITKINRIQRNWLFMLMI